MRPIRQNDSEKKQNATDIILTKKEAMTSTDEAMTVGELRKKIKNLPADTPVYLVTDKTSPYAWDDERERWRYAHPLAYASRERNYSTDMFGDDELVLLLEVENP